MYTVKVYCIVKLIAFMSNPNSKQYKMFCFKDNKFLILNNTWKLIQRNCQIESPQKIIINEKPPSVLFFCRLLGIRYHEGYKLYTDPKTKNLTRKDLNDIVKTVHKDLNYPLIDIYHNSGIFLMGTVSILNRHKILQECSFDDMMLSILAKYLVIMNKPIKLIKVYNYIKPEVSVYEKLVDCLEINVKKPQRTNEDISLNFLRKTVLNIYLKHKLNLKDEDINRIWKTYPRIKHKSFESIQKAIHILKNELNYPNDRILNNAFILHSDPENIENIIKEMPIIAGHDIREILYRFPKIMMTNCSAIKKTLAYLKIHGIPEEALKICFQVLTLGPETVNERLKDMKSVQEFDVLLSNPRIMKLLHYQNKARTRLDYLKQMKVKCASLHILSSNSESFEKYARDGFDRTKGTDVTFYLSKEFNVTEDEIRSILIRHPNSCHVPLTVTKDSLEFLKSCGFRYSDIYPNLHLILYPINRIQSKLDILKANTIDVLKLDTSKINDTQLLGLVLYLIERDFHFTGDGIWIDPVPHQPQVDTCVNIPEFPLPSVKKYKYGKEKQIKEAVTTI